MAVKRLSNFRIQYDDGNGVLASGYRLFFYAAGSSTKQNTYNSSTGLSANSNPITLNALGEPGVEIWLASGLTYKVVLAPSGSDDPPNAPVWTEDNISGVNDTTVSSSEWVAGPTPTYVSGTQFTLAGDQTSTFTVNRRIQATVTAGTVYGYVSVSAFAALTTITVVMDSGALDSGLSAVSVGLLQASNTSVPQQFFKVGTTPTAGDLNVVGSANLTGNLVISTNNTAIRLADSGATLRASAVLNASNQYIFGDVNSVGYATIVAAGGATSVTMKVGATSIAAASATGFNVASGSYSLAGTALPFQKLFTSADQTITAAGGLTLAHGLSTTPTFPRASLICQSADLNFAANDVVPIPLGQQSSDALNTYGVTVWLDATNINVRFGSGVGVLLINNKTTGDGAGIDSTKWKIRFYAASQS